MIARIAGKVAERKEGSLVVAAGGIFYEVLVPPAVMKAIEADIEPEGDIQLFTYHYYQTEPSRSTPFLIGFQNEVEKEFFEKFISVSGIGPKAACRALSEPFSSIAGAIDRGDTAFLKRLPGIGQRKAGEIVARLKGRVGKFGLIRDEGIRVTEGKSDIARESLEILLQLQYKRNEAETMIENAMKRKPGIRTSEDLLNEVYRERSAPL